MDDLKRRELKQNEINQTIVYEGLLQPFMSIGRVYIEQLQEYIDAVAEQLKKQGMTVIINDDFPNIFLTGHNKVSELVQRFKKAGLCFFAKAHEGIEYIDENYIGKALLNDILSRMLSAMAELNNFEDIITYAMQKDHEPDMAIASKGKIQRTILSLRNKINRTVHKASRYRFFEKCFTSSTQHANNYCALDKLLDDYKLEDNVVNALVKEIMGDSLDPEILTIFLDTEIKPDFEKLGISHLLPVLEERLVLEYKKSIRYPEQVNESNQDLYIPNFDRKKHDQFVAQYTQELKDRGEKLVINAAFVEQSEKKEDEKGEISDIGER